MFDLLIFWKRLALVSMTDASTVKPLLSIRFVFMHRYIMLSNIWCSTSLFRNWLWWLIENVE